MFAAPRSADVRRLGVCAAASENAARGQRRATPATVPRCRSVLQAIPRRAAIRLLRVGQPVEDSQPRGRSTNLKVARYRGVHDEAGWRNRRMLGGGLDAATAGGGGARRGCARAGSGRRPARRR